MSHRATKGLSPRVRFSFVVIFKVFTNSHTMAHCSSETTLVSREIYTNWRNAEILKVGDFFNWGNPSSFCRVLGSISFREGGE